MDQVSLGERELDVMTVLWTVGPGTVAEVKDRLPVALAYNTVLTILRNLEAKGLVDHEAEGRVFRYFPVATQQAVKKNAVARLVSKFFAGSPVDVMAHLLDSSSLSAAELRALHEHLDARLREMEEDDACS